MTRATKPKSVAQIVAAATELAAAYRLFDSGDAATQREATGLSQADLARLLGVSRGTVSRWEAGKRRPHAAAAVAYARLLAALGVGSAA